MKNIIKLRYVKAFVFVMSVSFGLRAIVGTLHEFGHYLADLILGGSPTISVYASIAAFPPFYWVTGFVYYFPNLYGISYAFASISGPIFPLSCFSLLFLVAKQRKFEGLKRLSFALIGVSLMDILQCMFPAENSTVGVNDGVRFLQGIGLGELANFILASSPSKFLNNWYFYAIVYSYIWTISFFSVTSFIPIHATKIRLMLLSLGSFFLIFIIGQTIEFFFPYSSRLFLPLAIGITLLIIVKK